MKNLKIAMSRVGYACRARRGRNFGLTLLLASAVYLGVVATAQAETCDITFYGDTGDSWQTGTGDDFYGRNNWDWCRDSWLGPRAKAFGMVYKSWKNVGWDDACNKDRAVGRFFAATVALETAARNAEQAAKDDILGWGYKWARDAIDNLKVACTGKKPRYAYTNWNGHVKLYIPDYFYSTASSTRTATLRAGTLIHETRHKKGKTHVPGSGGKDKSYESNGAWRYHANWLGWYARSANPAPKGQRCRAEQFANGIMANRFVQKNSIVWNFGVCEP